MTVIDTSVWIDFLRGRNPVDGDRLVNLLENGLAIGLSCVFGELLQGARSTDEQKVILEFWDNIPKLDENNFFIEAGMLSREHGLINKGVGLVDCYILAAVKAKGFHLWTLDKKLNDAYHHQL